MSRRRQAEKRKVLPDAKFGDQVLPKLINAIMQHGKKSIAESIVYDALETITAKVQGKNAVEVFHEALENIKPKVEVKSRRVGGATYQVPIEIRPERRQALGIRWLIGNSRSRPEKTMFQKLAGELMDAYNKWCNDAIISTIDKIVTAAVDHWQNIAKEMLALHQQDTEHCSDTIEALVNNNHI